MHEINTKLHTVQDISDSQHKKFHAEREQMLFEWLCAQYIEADDDTERAALIRQIARQAYFLGIHFDVDNL